MRTRSDDVKLHPGRRDLLQIERVRKRMQTLRHGGEQSTTWIEIEKSS